MNERKWIKESLGNIFLPNGQPIVVENPPRHSKEKLMPTYNITQIHLKQKNEFYHVY